MGHPERKYSRSILIGNDESIGADPGRRTRVENGVGLAVVRESFDEKCPGVDGVDVASDAVGVRLDRSD